MRKKVNEVVRCTIVDNELQGPSLLLKNRIDRGVLRLWCSRDVKKCASRAFNGHESEVEELSIVEEFEPYRFSYALEGAGVRLKLFPDTHFISSMFFTILLIYREIKDLLSPSFLICLQLARGVRNKKMCLRSFTFVLWTVRVGQWRVAFGQVFTRDKSH